MIIFKPQTKDFQKIRRVIKQGGVIIYPTDTLYGLGADIFNRKAVGQIFQIKGRGKKPISIMVSSLTEIKKIAYLNKKQEKIIKKLLPGPFTVILKKKKNISDLITAGSRKVGIRIPDSKFCQKLTKGLSITTTSANLSGQKPTLNFRQLTKIFGRKACLPERRVDLIIQGKNLSGKPSKVIDLTIEPPKILR